jgi:NADH-quinone oxidoreductase subunit L
MQPATYQTLYLIPLLPLIGAALLGIFGSRMAKDLVTTIALSSVLGAFAVVCLATAFLLRGTVPLENVLSSGWIAVGRWRFDLAFGLDWLSATLMLVVTGVGFLIHVYSVGYMRDDPSYWRYFAYLNLFIFAMSVLVLGRSLPIMFIGWEGVGLASYLLIGFWYTDEQKARAGMKAFVTNRVGDFGFLLGMFTIIALFGTADFLELQEAAKKVTDNTATVLSLGDFKGLTRGAAITIACLLLFLGATGKSAQIPLYVWLPDAMAGPTPVSALIHAATMVTAGVYMVARLWFLFDLAPGAQEIIAWIGAITAIMAATIGLAQNDIKKVLAYSTVSQLGYMFLAVGVGAYSAAIFHLVTHAFFKACLFLGSGAVIHALHGEQDMRNMGGLKKELPWVYRTFLVSTLALAGVFPFSGFFSKDAILANAFSTKTALWGIGFAAAGLTALYMARAVCLTFYGELRAVDSKGKKVHVHEPGRSMTIPLVILAALATVAGVWNLPVVMAEPLARFTSAPGGWFDAFLSRSLGGVRAVHIDHSTEWMLMGASLAMAITGLVIGYALYKDGPSPKLAVFTKAGVGRVGHWLLSNKYFVDEIYNFGIFSLRMFSSILGAVIDPWIIDGAFVKGSGYAVLYSGRLVGRLQTGNVQSYAAVFVIAIAAIILWAVQ